MLISNAPCSWGVAYPTGNKVGWRQYLDEVAAAGYKGTELGPFGYLPKDAGVVGEELARRGLTVVGATHVHTFADAATLPKLLADLREEGAILTSLGARHLVVMDEDNWYPEGRKGELDEAGWRTLAKGVEIARKLIEDELGLKASFHPHVGTGVQFEPQIDRLLDETDIDLCFDTGHHAFWGQDALTYFAKVRDRVAYVHLKNVDPAVRQRVLEGELTISHSYGAGVMCPLPDGAVDIPQVVVLMQETGFTGPVVVEQDLADNSPETPLELARRNLSFLKRAA
jgi:inosose dehydratase